MLHATWCSPTRSGHADPEHFGVEDRQRLARPAFHLGGDGISCCCARRKNADWPHGATPSADDHRPSPDLAGSASGAVASCPEARKSGRQSRLLLACRHGCISRMACPSGVSTRDAIRFLAHGRAGFVPGHRLVLLVACDSGGAAMVDLAVSVSRHLALRRTFGISCILRPHRLPRLPLHSSPFHLVRSRRSAVRRRAHVDGSDGCVSGSGHHLRLTIALTWEESRTRGG
jgi:hypothetical protein